MESTRGEHFLPGQSQELPPVGPILVQTAERNLAMVVENEVERRLDISKGQDLHFTKSPCGSGSQ